MNTTAATSTAATTATTSTTKTHAARRRAARTRIAGKQTFVRAIQSEWVKIRTLRSTWITSGIAVAITTLFGTGLAAAFASQPDYAEGAKHQITAGSAFGLIVMAVLGSLIITGEYSSGQIRSSLAAVPSRVRLLLAKAIVSALLAFVIGAASTLLSWAISYPFMKGNAGSLADMEYLGHIWGTGLAFAGVALMAMGLGYILRSTAGAITVVVTVLFVIDIPLSIMSMKWEWVNQIRGLEPLTLSNALTDPFSLANTWGVPDTTFFLEHWQALLVFGAWAVVPLAIGAAMFSRRDA